MAKRKQSKNDDLKHTVMDASDSKEGYGIVVLEVFLLSGMIGAYFHSWIIFAVVLVVLAGLMFVPILMKPLMVAFSVGWGVLGWAVGQAIGSIEASVVIALIFFIGALVGNFQAIDYMKKIADEEF